MKRVLSSTLVLVIALATASSLTGCGQTPAVQYSLTTSVSPAGSGSVTPASGSQYKQGTVVTLTATPATGYAFSSWNGPVVSNNGTYQIVMDKNQSVTANFTKLSYDVETTVEPAGVGSVDVAVVSPAALRTTVQHGETVRLTARATNPAYAFDHWEGALTGKNNPATLTVDGPKSITAIFSHRIAFASDRDDANPGFGYTSIYVMAADGANPTRLTYGSGYTDTNPAWSPDGTRIAFTRSDGTTIQIYVMNASDGSGVTQLTDATGDFCHLDPTWSPDGTQIAFSRYPIAGGNQEIWVMDANGNNQRQLTSGAGDFSPNWSPDGGRIVFASTRDGNIGVYVVNTAGGPAPPEALLTTSAYENFPVWSPDGAKIAFIHEESGNYDVWVMNADKSNQVALGVGAAKGLSGHEALSWSRDGQKIAFYAESGGNYDIYAVNAADGSLTRLTTGTSFDECPDW